MIRRFLNSMRSRYHPLYRLKQNRLFLHYVFPILDREVFASLDGISWPVRIRAMQHLVYWADASALEPGVTAFFRAYARSADPIVFWDVGANFGYYSWVVLSVNPTATALLFEPDPANQRLVSATLARNVPERAELLPVAIGAIAGEADFYFDRVVGATGSLLRDRPFADLKAFSLHQEIIRVPVVTLDDVAAEHAPPTLVKIDVEGVELDVVKGGLKVIERSKPFLLVESFEADRPALLELLESRGYEVVGADDPAAPLERNVNLLFVPPGKAAEWQRMKAAWLAALDGR